MTGQDGEGKEWEVQTRGGRLRDKKQQRGVGGTRVMERDQYKDERQVNSPKVTSPAFCCWYKSFLRSCSKTHRRRMMWRLRWGSLKWKKASVRETTSTSQATQNVHKTKWRQSSVFKAALETEVKHERHIWNKIKSLQLPGVNSYTWSTHILGLLSDFLQMFLFDIYISPPTSYLSTILWTDRRHSLSNPLVN